MKRRQFLQWTAAAFLPAGRLAAAAENSVAALPEAAPFIARMHQKHGFAPEEVRAFLGKLFVNPKVIRRMDAPSAPGKKVYWRDYRRRFLSPRSIADGAAFMRRHAKILARAEAEYGVPGEIITAVLGVETRYGKILGNFPVAEALATLAFAYPRRAEEFREYLEELLIYARRAKINPLHLRGSFAGAFGMPQFLPGSARRYAVDFNGNGRADLFTAADAAGSIGNYLMQHGWRRGGAALYRAQNNGDAKAHMAAVKQNGYKPLWTPRRLAEIGVRTEKELPEELYLLVDLENRYDTEYRVGGDNFYAVTRYNKSFKYAAAVFDLGAEIRARAS